MAKGECNCGAVAFEITSEISDVFVCHCSICRRSTGSNGIAVVVVSNSDFRWLRGEDLTNAWHKPSHD
ncbi:MAG: GFA family protein [Chloroflexota bacterium]